MEATDATRLLADIATKYERKFVEWRLASADPETSASRTSTIEGARKFTELRTAMNVYTEILRATGNGMLVIKIAQRLNTELPKPILPRLLADTPLPKPLPEPWAYPNPETPPKLPRNSLFYY